MFKFSVTDILAMPDLGMVKMPRVDLHPELS